MAIGSILSPVSWLLGTVAPPAWFQAVQDNINGWLAGTGPTFRALAIDGTGGATASNAAGSLYISTAGAQITLPTTTIAQGAFFKESAPLAWGRFTSTPNTQSAYNVASCTKGATGQYTVTLNTAATGATYLCPIVTLNNTTAGFVTFTITSSTVFVVRTFNASGVAADSDFGFVVFAG